MTSRGTHSDKRDLAGSLVFLSLGGLVLAMSLSLGIGSWHNPEAGFMPFWAALLMIVFSLILFGLSLRKPADAAGGAALWRGLSWPKSVIAVAGLIIYVAIVSFAGYLIATGLLMLCLFRCGPMKFRSAAIGAVLSVGLTYVLFHFILKIPLPRGIWGF